MEPPGPPKHHILHNRMIKKVLAWSVHCLCLAVYVQETKMRFGVIIWLQDAADLFILLASVASPCCHSDGCLSKLTHPTVPSYLIQRLNIAHWTVLHSETFICMENSLISYFDGTIEKLQLGFTEAELKWGLK